MTQGIDYGNLMHRAMRGLIRDVLSQIAEDGLPGDHHFFITFDTQHPDVQMAEWLCDRFPEEMTIVLQHWFDALTVDDEGFAVTLNFGDAPERMQVPYDAVRTFVDPSVEFGLRFDSQDDEEEEDAAHSTLHAVDENDSAEMDAQGDTQDDDLAAPLEEADLEVEPEKHDAEVVSLDSFRK